MDTHCKTTLQSPHKRIKRQHNHHYQNVHTNRGIINAEVPTVDFPYDVLDKIFSLLPIKQAIQMGSLSPRFKNSWLSARKLYFDKDFARSREQADFVRIVNHTFSLREGPIESFRLYFDPTGVENIVKKWIKSSIDKGVEELDLDFFQGIAPFKLPSDIVDIASITILKLCFCQVDLPPQLQGLSLLHTLVLKKVNVSSRLMETLFYNCTLLEFLDLTGSYTIRHLRIPARNLKKFKVLKVGDCPNVDRIEIDAPTLRSLHYCGRVVIFRFREVLQLNDVMLNFIPSGCFPRSFQVGNNLAYDLLHVNVLSTTGVFVEGLCSRVMKSFREKQLCFLKLKEFQLFMEGASFCNVYDIASFLKNCPCLENFFIDLNQFSFEGGPYWELHHRVLFEQYHQPFKCLRFIKVEGFKFQKYELELVKFLLQKAIFLETLILVTPKTTRAKVYAPDVLLYNRILCCWRTSPNAKITIFEHFNDRSVVFPKHSKIWF